MARCARLAAGPLVLTLIAALLIAGCGGSGPTSTSTSSVNPTGPDTAVESTSPATGTTTAQTATTAGTATTATTATSTVSTAANPTTTATTSLRPPEVPKGRRSQRSPRPTASSGVHLPATFIIRPGGAVTPPIVSAPTGVTIELQLSDADSRPHVVVLGVAGRPTERLAPGRHATVNITGLRDGTYTLLVDGKPGARLIVGAAPGP